VARLDGLRRVLRLGVWALVLLCPIDCKRPGPVQAATVWLGPLVVDVMASPGESPDLDRDALANQARAQLLQAGVFAGESRERKEGASLATVRIGLAMESVKADGKAAARAMVRLQIATRPEGVAPAHFTEDTRANVEMLTSPEAETKAVFQRLAERSVSDLLTSYLGRQKLWNADRATLHTRLQTADELRVEAIRVAAARKLLDEVPTLITLLSDDDESVRDAALGALVSLRDRRAVPALTKTRSMRDMREMGKIIEALAVLGGPEALDYLAFVADAHEDEEIRLLAAAALRRAKDQAGSKGGR
jgi:HEAT repeat protein